VVANFVPVSLTTGEGMIFPIRLVQDLAEEQLGAFVLRIVKELGRRVLFDDLALVHEDDTVGDLTGKPHFVCRAEHGHAFFGEPDHRLQHFLDHLRLGPACSFPGWSDAETG